MSTLLWVEHAKPFKLGSLLSKAGSSLKSILGLTSVPELVGTQLWKPEEALLESHYVEPDSGDFGIKINGEKALVSVSPGSAANKEAICISPDYWRTKLESALAAAVVIAIGEHSGSEITDPGWAYTKVPRSQSAKEFAETIKVDKTFDDINEAAEIFFSRLPMSPKKNMEGIG
jgi:hypothetical protein